MINRGYLVPQCHRCKPIANRWLILQVSTGQFRTCQNTADYPSWESNPGTFLENADTLPIDHRGNCQGDKLKEILNKKHDAVLYSC